MFVAYVDLMLSYDKQHTNRQPSAAKQGTHRAGERSATAVVDCIDALSTGKHLDKRSKMVYFRKFTILDASEIPVCSSRPILLDHQMFVSW